MVFVQALSAGSTSTASLRCFRLQPGSAACIVGKSAMVRPIRFVLMDVCFPGLLHGCPAFDCLNFQQYTGSLQTVLAAQVLMSMSVLRLLFGELLSLFFLRFHAFPVAQ